jgi:hypothetical protein
MWRMTGERMSENLLRPMTCQPERFMPLHENLKLSKKSARCVNKTVSLGDEEGAIQDV